MMNVFTSTDAAAIPSVVLPAKVKGQQKREATAKTAHADLPGLDIQVTSVSTLDELIDWVPAWNRLTETALENNVFYEPSCLIPALRHLNREGSVQVLLAWSTPRVFPEGPKVLCGILPVVSGNETTRFGSKLGCGGLTAWQHPHCYLSMPLLRQDVAIETLRALWQYAGSSPASSLWLTLPCVPAEGPFQHTLTQFLQETELPFCVRSLHRRALFKPCDTAEQYLDHWSRSRRHTVKRLEKKLKEMGTLRVRILQADEPIEPWISQFMELESSGWKGKAGSALAAADQDQAFVAEMLNSRWETKQVSFLSLELDGKPIAMKCNLLTGQGAFAWKIAYDERFYKFSPGNILEKATIELLHEQDVTQWMDSCAAPNHPMIDGLWQDRRILQSISVGTQRRGSALGVALLPVLRWTQRTLASFARSSKQISPVNNDEED